MRSQAGHLFHHTAGNSVMQRAEQSKRAVPLAMKNAQ
jgi:hypothetical protein